MKLIFFKRALRIILVLSFGFVCFFLGNIKRRIIETDSEGINLLEFYYMTLPKTFFISQFQNAVNDCDSEAFLFVAASFSKEKGLCDMRETFLNKYQHIVSKPEEIWVDTITPNSYRQSSKENLLGKQSPLVQCMSFFSMSCPN